MIKYTITFTTTSTAIGGFFQYRYLNPNGTYTPASPNWTTCTTLGNTIGYFPINTPSITLSNVSGNPPDFLPNTTYEFRIKQLCQDGSEVYSAVSEDHYVAECPSFSLSTGDYSTVSNSYPIFVTVVNAVGKSITSFTFKIYDPDDLVTPLTTETVPAQDVQGNLPYQYEFNDNNVPGGIVQGVNYYVSISFTILTSTGPVVTDCDLKQIEVPTCYMWKVATADAWMVQWTDCEGNTLMCGGTDPYKVGNLTDLYLCSPTKPTGYWCNNGQLSPPRLDPGSGSLLNGALVNPVNVGPCKTEQYDYDTSGSLPILNGYTCQECPPDPVQPLPC